ncbi:LytTR family DNA-binding domain-containing protein [Chitinophaga sp.]|uniref:LytR/AlgR family response regulator transcription factor n=1 Tax=Chitinophaga sp. TaxID=1869181 RepID=UPI0031E029EB
MMTCIIVDDEPKALEVIIRYCQKSSLLNLKATFREPVKAIEYLQREKIDLVFLDINMPDIDGMQLVQSLAVKPMIIFTTAYASYAVESYNLNAVDYLLKPVTFDRFLTAINKAGNLKNSTPAGDETIFIKSGSQTYQVKIADILYLEKEGNYITVHLRDKKILMRENMGDIFDLFPSTEFVRVHKSYVVAIRHISVIEVHQVIVNNAAIPIGSTFREDFRKRLGVNFKS